MKLVEIFRFEVAYQLRRPWPWLAFAVLLVFAYQNTRVGIMPVTLPQDFVLNSPFIIASVTVFSCIIWLLVASPMAGEAAARDVQTGMHPLVYTSPVSRAEYLAGRFLAALLLNALVLLGVQAGSLLAVYAGGIDPEIIGPFRPTAYLAAYTFIALPNALVATSIQFAAALLTGRSMASYVGSVIILFFTFPVPLLVYMGLGKPDLALLLDPIGMFAIMNEMMLNWTIVEKNVRMFTLDGAMLRNRVLWTLVAGATLALVYGWFRFAHRTAEAPWNRLADRWARRRTAGDRASAPRPRPRLHRAGTGSPTPADAVRSPATIVVPQVPRSFGTATHVRQTLSIAGVSFRTLAMSVAGLFLLVVFPAFVVLVVVVSSEHWGIQLLPRTGYIVPKYIASPLTAVSDYRAIVPLLIVYFTGELVWRERSARLNETVDTTSVPEWVLMLGKFAGLTLLLAVFLLIVSAAGMLAQFLMGYPEHRIDLYLEFLLGLQLPEYLLFAVLAFAIHAAVDDRYIALLGCVVVWALIVLAGWLGVEHRLLVYSASPAWDFTDIRGFGSSLGPWLWFKLYWAAWALLLAVSAQLLWVRGKDTNPRARLRIARQRLTRPTIAVGTLAVTLIVALGGFIFYNTNVRNEYITRDEMVERRAEYERRYGMYEGIPQPQRTATNLHIEIHPDRRSASVRGSYLLVNRDSAPIARMHLEPAFHVRTRLSFDRPARPVVTDDVHGHYIYELDVPLLPGDSLTLSFEVRSEPDGFRNDGAASPIVANGSHFTSGALPIIGYQPMRELWSADDRRAHGLPRQLTLRPPSDIDPHAAAAGASTFEAVIATAEDQVAVAPGELRRTWTAAGRRYFHYVSDVPIGGTEFFFSADYTVHRERWKDVEIQVFVHPGHARHVERVLRSVRASLEYYSAQFGDYPWRFLQVVEQPGNFLGMGVDGSGVITGGEGFFLLDPKGDGFDAMFEIVAHEMGHQWWGTQLRPALAEGGGIISEGLAWYSAMRLVKHVQGPAALQRFTSLMRRPSPWPPIRTGLPLLRAMDPWANYRKAPYAMHALSEYIGEDRVNGALRRLVEQKATSLATTLDLYRELEAVTPDSLRYLLRDLFETNTIWELTAERANAEQTSSGEWQVTLDVHARKLVSDTAGSEAELPMDEWIEIGVFGAREPGMSELSAPLYLEKHRIRSGTQTITVTVPRRPVLAGIDPHHLLDWVENDDDDNIAGVTVPDG